MVDSEFIALRGVAEEARRASRIRVLPIRNADQRGGLRANPTWTLLTALYVLADDLLPQRRGPGRPPSISATPRSSLAITQILLDRPKERAFLRMARRRLWPPLSPRPSPGGLRRARAPAGAADHPARVTVLARLSPCFCDRLRLLDSTPVPCAQSRETVERSQLAGYAGYGYCASHSRFFWDFASTCSAPRTGCRSPSSSPPPMPRARGRGRMLERRRSNPARRLSSTRAAPAEEFERAVRTPTGPSCCAPTAATSSRASARSPEVRQWIESIVHTSKDQLSLERHGARTLQGLIARIAQRLLALAAGCSRDWHAGHPPAATSPPMTTDWNQPSSP